MTVIPSLLIIEKCIKLKRLITVKGHLLYLIRFVAQRMTEKVAFNRCFVPHDDKIECERAKATNLRNMLYTSAALVDVKHSLEVSYVYVSIIIEYSKLLALNLDKKELNPQRYLIDRKYVRSKCIELI